MLKNNRIKIIAVTTFCAIETVLFFLVQCTRDNINIAVSYISVILACLFMATSFSKTSSYVFTQFGLIFTVFADYFLVVLDPIKQLPAMIFFSGTQIFYFLRLYLGEKSEQKRKIHLILRVIISLVAIILTFVVLKDEADAVSVISMFYYANLLTNIIAASMQIKGNRLFLIGLVLFIMCDTAIGINELINTYLESENASQITDAIFGKFNVPWLFYVPSQTLIALSLTDFKTKREEKQSS